MKFIGLILLITLFKTQISFAVEDNSLKQGGICFGPNLSKVQLEKDLPNIKVTLNESSELFFKEITNSLAFNNLNLNTQHIIKVKDLDGEIYEIKFSFKNFKTKFVVLFKDAGGWKIGPADSASCNWPVSRCSKGYACKKYFLWLIKTKKSPL